jgi:Uma2 family endonuclease
MTATLPTTYLLTADELFNFPDDGKRREIIEGVLYVAAAPSRLHQKVLSRLHLLVGNLVEETKSGEAYFSPVDVRFSAHDLVQPDLIYIRRERLHLYRGHIMDGPPDVVMEVISPSNRGYDLTEKARLYEKYAVPEYWVFDPENRKITHLVLIDGRHAIVEPVDGIYRSTVIPGLAIDAEVLFADLDAW